MSQNKEETWKAVWRRCPVCGAAYRTPAQKVLTLAGSVLILAGSVFSLGAVVLGVVLTVKYFTRIF